MIGKQIFRKEALRRLSSPEQLDQLITVTEPRGWLSLLAISLIILTTLFWAITGEIPVTIVGKGILLRTEGRHKIISPGSGIISELKVSLDACVKKDEVIAVISQPEMEYELEKLKKELESLQAIEKKDEDLLRDIDYLEIEIQEARELTDLYSIVKSPRDGQIVSLVIDEGDFVKKESVIAVIENSTKDIGGIFYIPLETGKQIKPGMKVRIAPSIAKSQEFGFIPGEVSFVSEFPSSIERMMAILENNQLVDKFSTGSGTSLEVHVRLEKDTSTKSGFKWSSSKGPDIKISSGTLCDGTVILDTFHPISLVLGN